MATTKKELETRLQEIQKQFNELQVEANKIVGKLELLSEQEKDKQ